MLRYATVPLLLVMALLIAGCRTTPAPRSTSASPAVRPSQPRPVLAAADAPGGSNPSTIRPVVFQQQDPEPLPAPAAPENDTGEEFGLQEFVAEVIARHPSVEAMVAAWQAAAQRYPQVVSLEDPMFMAMTAPSSLNSIDVEGAYALELRQKFPWFGKRSLRGQAASEEAAAAAHEIDDARLKVALMAQVAYIDYYLADRQLALNGQTVELVNQFREIAQARYRTNQVTQQDVLQADLELAELSRRKLELQRMRRTATARMNTLLLRSPELPFPRPELTVTPHGSLDDSSLLLAWAMQTRPDLLAQSHRIDVESANLELTYKQYRPDAELFGRYDTFWQPASTQGDLRGQVGVVVNLPVYRRKLNAAVCEAQFRLRQERAKYEQLAAEIRLEVQTALEQVKESEQAVRLYESQLLPAAEQYLAAARSNYEVGKATSLDFVQAQRQLLMAREKQLEAKAMFAQRLVELERSIGGSLPRPEPGETN